MKIIEHLNPKHSIANRITWQLFLTLFGVFTVFVAILLAVIFAVGGLSYGVLYNSALKITNERVNNVFSLVEVAVNNNVTEAEECIGDKHRQYYPADHLLRLNPNIVGSAIALNPDCEPFKGEWLAPYAYRDSSNNIQTKQLTAKEYDYVHQEWFTKPLTEGRGVWTEPYIDKGGGDLPMITYSQPIINAQGEIYAVHTADIALDWLGELTAKMDSTNNVDFNFDNSEANHSYSFIVTQKGTFVSYPRKGHVLKENMFDHFRRRAGSKAEGDSIATEIANSDKPNNFLFYKDVKADASYVIFFAPLERTGWRIAIAIPLMELLEPAFEAMRGCAILIAIGLLIIVWVCRRSIHKVTRPLTVIAQSADEIAKGNFHAELPEVHTQDEMKKLRDSFDTMQQSLTRQMEETRKANEEKGRINSELQIAKTIQLSMLPKTFPPYPDRTDIDIYGQLKAAKEIGGDLYDFFLRDEKLFFCIGDVSGKGVPASLVMAVTRTLFRNIAAHTAEPGRIIYALNNSLSEGNDSMMFVTMFIGVLDLPTGRLRYSNAGHDAPLLIGDQGVGFLPCDPNLPIGVQSEWKFSQQEVMIDPQTSIFLYTDGLTEAENVAHDQFQDIRVVDVARQAERKPVALIRAMTDAVADFVGGAEQNDDLTMLCIQYTHEKLQDSRLNRSLTLSNDVEEVPQLAAFVDEVCEAVGFDMPTTMSLNLALEEAVVNVMNYAYPGTKGDVTIDALANDIRLKFVITDHGVPFDPTEKSEVDTTLSAEERPIGGLGIHLVRQIMDSINYERLNGKNVLTLRKKLV